MFPTLLPFLYGACLFSLQRDITVSEEPQRQGSVDRKGGYAVVEVRTGGGDKTEFPPPELR